jgi:hypothetical protein
VGVVGGVLRSLSTQAKARRLPLILARISRRRMQADTAATVARNSDGEVKSVDTSPLCQLQALAQIEHPKCKDNPVPVLLS